jgi:predicted outer membrane repeat protein
VNGGVVQLTNLKITGGSADIGGGILSYGTLILRQGVVVSRNKAISEGGGIYTEGFVTLRGSATVSRNSSPGGGGGIYTITAVFACNSTGVDKWTGTVEPNTPNDFRDKNVTRTTCK